MAVGSCLTPLGHPTSPDAPDSLGLGGQVVCTFHTFHTFRTMRAHGPGHPGVHVAGCLPLRLGALPAVRHSLWPVPCFPRCLDAGATPLAPLSCLPASPCLYCLPLA